jgi:RNA polymerase-associated protein CTR9
LETYLAVYDFLKSNGKSDDLSVQLLNNISALCFVLGDFHRSNEFLTLALAKLENDEELALDHSMMTTLLYNKGRLCEVFSDWNSAEDSYLRVLAAHPAYVDAYLRLGHVASSKGDSEEADFWFAEAAALDPENPEPSILQGDLLFRQGKFDAARDKYHLILKNHPDETYVLLKFAESCVESFRSGVSDAAQKKGLVEKAFSHFQRVLRVDSTNPYAVNGMGVVLALTGE